MILPLNQTLLMYIVDVPGKMGVEMGRGNMDLLLLKLYVELMISVFFFW